MIYLDNSLTTKPSERALSAMQPYLTQMWGATSAPHQMGQQLFPAMEQAYQSLYQLLGAKEEDNVYFVSSGAEAVNQAFLSAYQEVMVRTGKNQFITSNIDEAPAILSLSRLEELGCVGKMAKANAKGEVTADAVADLITPRTALVSLSWANGLTGVVQPVAEIATLCQERGILLHLDASHVLGKLYFELEDIGADFISFNGDNLHAPRGTGGLYVKSGVKSSPLILGAGSINTAGLIGLGQAANEVVEGRDLLCMEVARLRDRLEKGVQEGFPDAVLFFRESQRLPNITCIGFPGSANEALLYRLHRKGVYASMGGGTFQQIGLILMASGVDETLAHSSISFSLSRETTEEDVDRAVDIIVEEAKQLQRIACH